jgi:hypothetical protein
MVLNLVWPGSYGEPEARRASASPTTLHLKGPCHPPGRSISLPEGSRGGRGNHHGRASQMDLSGRGEVCGRIMRRGSICWASTSRRRLGAGGD